MFSVVKRNIRYAVRSLTPIKTFISFGSLVNSFNVYLFSLEIANSLSPLVGNAIARLEKQHKIAKLMMVFERSMTGRVEGLRR